MPEGCELHLSCTRRFPKHCSWSLYKVTTNAMFAIGANTNKTVW
jgi:hypothetical protein